MLVVLSLCLGELDVEVTDHHFVGGLIAPPDPRFWVGNVKGLRGVIMRPPRPSKPALPPTRKVTCEVGRFVHDWR